LLGRSKTHPDSVEPLDQFFQIEEHRLCHRPPPPTEKRLAMWPAFALV